MTNKKLDLETSQNIPVSWNSIENSIEGDFLNRALKNKQEKSSTNLHSHKYTRVSLSFRVFVERATWTKLKILLQWETTQK